MESPSPRTFVFVDVNPKHSNSKHITQVVKSQARAYSHQQRIKREARAGGDVVVVQKRQRRLLKPQQEQAAKKKALIGQIGQTAQACGCTPESDDNDTKHASDLQQPTSLLSILGAGRVDPFIKLPSISNNLPLRKYLDHWITVLAPTVCGLAPGETNQPSMQSVWVPMAYGDPTLLIATMFSSVAHLEFMKSPPGPEYFILRGHTIELVKRNVEDPKKCLSDSNIAAVLILCRFGNDRKGGPVQNEPHKAVLKRMVELRGGLENLGINGVLAKLIIQCDILTATFEGKTSNYFPNHPFTPTYHSPFSSLRKFASSSPLLDCGDMDKVEASPVRGKEISKIVYELQEDTIIFRDSYGSFLDPEAEEDNASRNHCLELDLGVSLTAMSETFCKSDKYVFGACSLAWRIYRRAVVYGIPFADEINRDPMLSLRMMLERIGIESSWARIPGILVWILLTGGAAAEGTAEKDYFVVWLVRMGLGLGLQNFDEFRIAILNFNWLQKELARRLSEARFSPVDDARFSPKNEWVYAKG